MEIHATRITDIHAVRNGHVVIHADMSRENLLDILTVVPDSLIAEYAALHGIKPEINAHHITF